MSDQGDAGKWRPATSQNDRYSTPDDTTGPLPAVSGDEDETPGFPPVGSSSSSEPPPVPSWARDDDDDAPTGGFPAVSMPEDEPPAASPARTQRSPFEPADPTGDTYDAPAPRAPEPEDPGPADATPRFGTDVPDARPAAESSFGSFGSEPADDEPYDDKPQAAGRWGEETYQDPPREERAYGQATAYDDRAQDPKPREGFEAGAREEPEGSWAPRTYGSTRSASPGRPATGGLPPAQGKGVTAEDQDAENEFFASDDHPPMWDKVVAPTGPPPKPGKPSSGNLRLPEWMRDENGGDASGSPRLTDISEFEDDGKSRRALVIGLSVLVAGLLAAGGAYLLKGNGDSEASNAAAPTQSTPTPSTAPTQPTQTAPVRKQMPVFKGEHTKATGRLSDPRAGLSYARFSKPWAPAPKKGPMNEIGFTASQFAVTEKAGSRPKHWARLMSAPLAGAARTTYDGPGTERDAALELERLYEARMFAFRHRTHVLASQPLNVGGHKGWLVSDYVTYKRPGSKATGDVVAVALVDTGRKAPGVLFMSVPNNSRKLWPDINYVVRSLKVG